MFFYFSLAVKARDRMSLADIQKVKETKYEFINGLSHQTK
jgi:hypothetical protein